MAIVIGCTPLCDGLLARDLNFTISSICRILQALERPTVRELKVLFDAPLQNSFFEAFTHEKLRCTSSISSGDRDPSPPSLPERPAVALPRKLFLQLNNSTKDNKNKFVMAFCSLLTAMHIFKEVTVSFLIVSENIDVYFNNLSKLLKTRNMYVLADLMKAFMDSKKTVVFILEVVQEVAGFKKYVKDFHHDGANSLTGLGKMHLFKFFMEADGDDHGWPVMRDKVPLNFEVADVLCPCLISCGCIGLGEPH
jgi:hypothetical protein